MLGVIVRLSPVEEMIWSKAFIQERERFDGADVLHLLRETGPSLDWPRLLMRFGDYWRVLLSHLILFGFVYPDKRQNIPAWVMDELMRRLSVSRPNLQNDVCYGTLLSREQYLHDIERWKYRDGREAAGRSDDRASRSRSGPRRSTRSSAVPTIRSQFVASQRSSRVAYCWRSRIQATVPIELFPQRPPLPVRRSVISRLRARSASKSRVRRAVDGLVADRDVHLVVVLERSVVEVRRADHRPQVVDEQRLDVRHAGVVLEDPHAGLRAAAPYMRRLASRTHR